MRRAYMLTAALVLASCSSEDDPEPADAGVADTGQPSDGGQVVGPGCGNGILETNEICEGFELREATCVSEGFTTGRLACTDNCELDTSGCSTCGDGQISGDEACEPDDLAGATCESELGTGFTGTLACSPDCTQVTTEACRQEIPAQGMAACDPASANPCADQTQSCVETSVGAYCFELCDVNIADDCGAGGTRFCFEFEGTGICLDTPDLGEVCTAESGCLQDAGECVPAFSATASTISICADVCTADMIGIGTGMGCDMGQACMPVPSGQLEVQLPQVECMASQACDELQGFQCLPTSLDGSSPNLCMRPVTVCAEPIPFFAFNGTSSSDSICDLATPTQGLKMCGIGENAGGVPGPMASAICYPLLAGNDSFGVCVGFCDSTVLDTPSDGFCGDGFECSVPTQPEFYLAEDPATAVTCDPANNACGGAHPNCLDLGRGPECSRPARMCIPE